MAQEAATDPALVAAISGGAAILGGLIGGGLGYRGVTRQMKEQREADHHQYRRETYLAFLDVANRFMRGSGVLRYDTPKWLDFVPEYEHKLNAVLLVGVPEVVASALEVQRTLREMVKDVEHKEGVSPEDARRTSLRAHEHDIRQALASLKKAMRADLGPTG